MDYPRANIKLRQIEYFLGVAKSLHFSQTAEDLSVTQPTLSHQIAELEAQLGTPLFNRKGKTITLTEAGMAFRGYATRALAEIAAGRDALADLAGLQSGRLRIGVSQSFVRMLLPPLLGQFVARYPAIDLTVTEMTAAEIENGLANSHLDIGIAFAPTVLDETELEPLIEERLILVANKNHPLAERESVAMAELDGLPMALMSPNYSTRRMIDGYLAQAGATPLAACESNSIAVMLGMVANSNVLSIVPEGAIDESAAVAMIPLTDPVPIRVSALLWSRHSFRSRAARVFADLVRAHFPAALSTNR